MDANSQLEQAIEVLLELGLKEYEAKCFVTLSRMPSATAKDISETTDVPRTRVYDAIRVLEAKGLVEIQHSSPQQFRAVPVDEAVETLQDSYESRMQTLRDALQGIDPVEVDDDSVVQEVWSMTGSQAIRNRTRNLLEEATDEIVLVIGEEELLTGDLLAKLAETPDGVILIVGVLSESERDRIREAVPEARVFISGLEWLRGGDAETAIGRLLLIDRETLLVSSWEPNTGKEHAIFGRGFSNGLVVLSRRLMATGLLPIEDPGKR